MENYFSKGKLLLTGEYAVLDGALALAIPTKYGQQMSINFEPHHGTNTLTWHAFDNDGNPWYSETFYIDTALRKITPTVVNICSSHPVTNALQTLINHCLQANLDFLNDGSYSIRTKLDFPNNWGLGSSSTLISNLAKWASVDAFELSKVSFGGSSVDVAVGMLGTPVLFRNTDNWEGIVYNPPFKNSLYFVHLNKKQNSRDAVSSYKNAPKDEVFISQITELTLQFLEATSLDMLQDIITKHEEIVSLKLNLPTVKSLYFEDYPFAMKSLGAWGGDFILVCGDENTPTYFGEKGFATCLAYKNLIAE